MNDSKHFLQSSAWGEFQRSLDREVFERHGDGWSFMAILETGRLTHRLYCPYGPTVRDQTALREAIRSLHSLARKLRVDYIRIEPMSSDTLDMKAFDAYRAARDVQPRHTLTVDLTQDENTILKGVTSGNRRSYTNAEKNGLTFRSSTKEADLKLFLQCLKNVAMNTGMKPHSEHYFTAQAKVLMPTGHEKLLIAEHTGTAVAFCIVYDNDHTRYYAHAAADYEMHKLQPAAALLCFAMLDAKERGLSRFDMYGVAPADKPKHPWAGFSRFKRSFGGTETTYTGTWEIPLNPLLHRFEHAVNTLEYTRRHYNQQLTAQKKRLKRATNPMDSLKDLEKNIKKATTFNKKSGQNKQA